MNDTILRGKTVVSIAPNLPGPAAARELRMLGARVIKVESPAGDPMQSYSPEFYQWLNEGQEIITIDLRAGLGRLHQLLDDADVLITSSRTDSLKRLGLSPDEVHARHQHIGYVAIVGHNGDEANIPGHDLTYQAEASALVPGVLPRQLVADFAGAQRATSFALAAIYHNAHTGQGSFFEVSLAERAAWTNTAYRFGLTGPSGILGGNSAYYGMYQAADSTWIAVACLEPKFSTALREHVGISPTASEAEQKQSLADFFAAHPGSYWDHWALNHDLPIVALR